MITIINYKSKKINISQLLNVFVVLGFSLFLIRIINDGKVLMYVHPRIVPYLKLAAYLMLVICPFMLKNMTAKKARAFDSRQYIIVGFALLLAFTVPPAIMSTSSSANKLRLSVSPGTAANTKAVNAESSGGNEAGTSSLLVIDSENYVDKFYDMGEDMDDYIGRKIQISGFVYEDDKMKDNEFVIGRYCMSCCTADLSLTGFLIDYGQAGGLKRNGWYSITGIMGKGSYDGQVVPEIKALEVQKIQKPEYEYVYP